MERSTSWERILLFLKTYRNVFTLVPTSETSSKFSKRFREDQDELKTETRLMLCNRRVVKATVAYCLSLLHHTLLSKMYGCVCVCVNSPPTPPFPKYVHVRKDGSGLRIYSWVLKSSRTWRGRLLDLYVSVPPYFQLRTTFWFLSEHKGERPLPCNRVLGLSPYLTTVKEKPRITI